jgi:hypothetical protein
MVLLLTVKDALSFAWVIVSTFVSSPTDTDISALRVEPVVFAETDTGNSSGTSKG